MDKLADTTIFRAASIAKTTGVLASKSFLGSFQTFKGLNFVSTTFAILSSIVLTFAAPLAPCCGQDSTSSTTNSAKPTSSSQTAEHKFRFEMTDKTRIIGFSEVKSIDMDLGFSKVAIPIEKIRSLKLAKQTKSETRDHFVIELHNRDRYSGRILNPPIKARFLGGEIELPFDAMQTLHVITDGGSSPPIISDGLVLYYDFEGNETVVKNRAEAKHHGKMGNGISRVDSKNNRGLKFTGQRSLETKKHNALCPQRFTFSVWLKPGQRDGQYCLVGGKTKHDGWLGGFAFVYMNGDTNNIYFYVEGYNRYVIKTPLPAKKWTHLSGVFDGKKVILYANGKSVGSVEFPKGRSITYHNDDPFSLGGETSDCYWHGEMDEVSLHNRALSPEEVKDLFESTRN